MCVCTVDTVLKRNLLRNEVAMFSRDRESSCICIRSTFGKKLRVVDFVKYLKVLVLKSNKLLKIMWRNYIKYSQYNIMSKFDSIQHNDLCKNKTFSRIGVKMFITFILTFR